MMRAARLQKGVACRFELINIKKAMVYSLEMNYAPRYPAQPRLLTRSAAARGVGRAGKH